MQSLINLPEDVTKHIITFLTKSSDLRQLCLTCRHLHRIAVPQLYRHIVIVGECKRRVADTRKWLNHENKNLQYLRHITIYAGENDRDGGDGIWPLLVNELPRDILLTVTTKNSRRHGNKDWEDLHQKQRYLQSLRCIEPLGPSERLVNGQIDLSHITTLQLWVTSGCQDDARWKLLDTTPCLRHLQVRTNLQRYDSEESLDCDYKDADHRARLSAEIIQDLFRNFLSGEKEPLKLRTLELLGFDLFLASEMVRRCIDVSTLETLSLQHCDHALTFLGLLRSDRGGEQLNLRALLIITSESTTSERNRGKEVLDDEKDNPIDDFLCSFSGLQHLTLDIALHEPHLRPGLRSIAAHSKTLRWLFLRTLGDEDGAQGEFYKAAALKETLKQCVLLEQLALHTPKWPLVEPTPPEAAEKWEAFLDALAALPKLRFLRAMTHPPERTVEMVSRSFYEARMQQNADDIFSSSSSLRALGLRNGKRYTYPGTETFIWVLPLYYIRGCKLDVDGKETGVGRALGWFPLRELEPASEIFDVELGDCIDTLPFEYLLNCIATTEAGSGNERSSAREAQNTGIPSTIHVLRD